MNQPELGKRILELRTSKGLTQQELAETCNLSLRTIQRIESAQVTPRSHTTKSIFSQLGFQINNLSDVLPNTSQQEEDTAGNWLEQFFKYVKELFNLKTNTVKKLSVLSLAVVAIVFGIFFGTQEIRAQKIEGWFLAGSNPKGYSIGLDKQVFKTGMSSAYLISRKNKTSGFGTLMQKCSAKEYLGKRVRMTSYIKTEKVTRWVGMWLRVDAKGSKKILSFDNMSNRAIKNTTDWQQYEIILDVPEESGSLNYGILLDGPGKVWFDNIRFEVVEDLNTKTSQKKLASKPSNLDFGG